MSYGLSSWRVLVLVPYTTKFSLAKIFAKGSYFVLQQKFHLSQSYLPGSCRLLVYIYIYPFCCSYMYYVPYINSVPFCFRDKSTRLKSFIEFSVPISRSWSSYPSWPLFKPNPPGEMGEKKALPSLPRWQRYRRATTE